VQRDEWTEEVNEALWIDEKVSVRVHKVKFCPVLSKLGLTTVKPGQQHKLSSLSGAQFHQAPMQVAVHSARPASLHRGPVQLQLVRNVCQFMLHFR
jgi:hypothetical protein